jgi:ubiquinone/menaquinone biosynthesis C-methylase UbiE
MVRRARAKLNGEGSRVRLTVGDSENIPFAAGTFDVVTCSNSFHHYPNQLAALREMHRVLRPGGRLLVVDGFRDNLIGRIMYDVIVTRVEGDVWHRDARDMRDLMEQVGFRNVTQATRSRALFPLLLTRGTVP